MCDVDLKSMKETKGMSLAFLCSLLGTQGQIQQRVGHMKLNQPPIYRSPFQSFIS